MQQEQSKADGGVTVKDLKTVKQQSASSEGVVLDYASLFPQAGKSNNKVSFD